MVFSVYTFDKFQLDDPVGATSVHLVNGIWGTLAVGLFASPKYFDGKAGLFYGGGAAQLGIQLLGVLSVAVAILIGSFLLWSIIKAVFGLRVSREEEIGGLDVGEMGLEGYSGFQIFTTEDISPLTTNEPTKNATSFKEVRNETGSGSYSANKAA